MNRSDSDKNISLTDKITPSRKYTHVPLVKTTLYSQQDLIKFTDINTLNEITLKRTNSLNLKSARSLSKAKRDLSTNTENTFNSDESLSNNETNSKITKLQSLNLDNIKIKLDNLKLNIKKIGEKRNGLSLSPIKINYDNLRNFKETKKIENFNECSIIAKEE